MSNDRRERHGYRSAVSFRGIHTRVTGVAVPGINRIDNLVSADRRILDHETPQPRMGDPIAETLMAFLTAVRTIGLADFCILSTCTIRPASEPF